MLERLNREPEVCLEAKPCPFCGSKPYIEFWHGGAASKRLIGCSSCEVSPSVTGETKAQALERWNARPDVFGVTP